MSMVPYFVGLAVFVALLLAIVCALFLATADAEQKRRQHLESRQMGQQPWDAHGNR